MQDYSRKKGSNFKDNEKAKKEHNYDAIEIKHIRYYK